MAQAAAGDAFCVTREANAEDAARAIEGFPWMKSVRSSARIFALLRLSSTESAVVHHAGISQWRADGHKG